MMAVVNWQDAGITARRRITASGGLRRRAADRMSVSKQNNGQARSGAGRSAARSRCA